ncbi:MAG: hypothetical protein KF819_37460 [Labilithrix sp.]|nr:hypothetical protein [Labilithrix sp.]
MAPLQWRRHALLSLIALLALALSGCERGCAGSWLAQQGSSPSSGGEGPGGSAARDAASALLEGTDCGDGLARCVEGRLESSLAAHLPHPCRETERGRCVCPWESIGRCAAGCVRSGLEIVATPEVARAQLCRPEIPVLRALLPADVARVEICGEEGTSCVDGIVRVCAARGQPVRPVAACAFGCAIGVGIDPADLEPGGSPIADGPAPILCRRADAERR